MSFKMALLEEVVLVAGDSNMEFPAHCRVPEGREISDLPEVPAIVDAKKMKRVEYRFNRARR